VITTQLGMTFEQVGSQQSGGSTHLRAITQIRLIRAHAHWDWSRAVASICQDLLQDMLECLKAMHTALTHSPKACAQLNVAALAWGMLCALCLSIHTFGCNVIDICTIGCKVVLGLGTCSALE